MSSSELAKPSGAGSEAAVSEGSGRKRLRPVLLLVGTGVALVLLGAVLGVVGSFLNDTAPHILGVGVPVGVVLAVVGNGLSGLLGTRGTGSRLGGALPGIAWFTVVLLFGSLRPEGDLIVTGNGHGVAFIVLGGLAACLGLLPGGGSPAAAAGRRQSGG